MEHRAHEEDYIPYNPYNPEAYNPSALAQQPEAHNDNQPPYPSFRKAPGPFLSNSSKRNPLVRGYGQGNLCTKGGRLRCIGRICCCSLMTTVFLIVSVVLALALFIRPPSITIGSVQPLAGSVGNSNSASNNGISIQLGVDISVVNPNYFDVDFKEIKVELFYPIGNTPVGGGTASNIDFKTRSQTNFTFPFTLSYNSSQAQADAIFSDLAAKCGVSGGAKSNLNVDYKITLGIRILMATIFPVISNTFNFPCPISPSDISKLLAGLNLRDLD